ncbi:RNA polymerase sigma factor [Planctomycetota bacterium]
MNNLLERYREPVYWYLRRKGHSDDRAEDLTQGFFFEIVLGRSLIPQADQSKGRFRTFLLTALDRYLVSTYRKESAKKRAPQDGLTPLGAVEIPDTVFAQSSSSPEQAFCYAWATSLLDEVFDQIKQEYCSTNREAYWQIFHARIVAPTRENGDPPAFIDLCRKYCIETERKARNILITVKRRFATVLRMHIRQHVRSDAEVEEELQDLMEILSKGGAA